MGCKTKEYTMPDPRPNQGKIGVPDPRPKQSDPEERTERKAKEKESSFDWKPIVLIGLVGATLFGGFNKSLEKFESRHKDEDEDNDGQSGEKSRRGESRRDDRDGYRDRARNRARDTWEGDRGDRRRDVPPRGGNYSNYYYDDDRYGYARDQERNRRWSSEPRGYDGWYDDRAEYPHDERDRRGRSRHYDWEPAPRHRYEDYGREAQEYDDTRMTRGRQESTPRSYADADRYADYREYYDDMRYRRGFEPIEEERRGRTEQRGRLPRRDSSW